MPIYMARHVLPVASPPITDGAVAVKDNMVIGVGARKSLLADAGDEPLRDLGEAVLLPGLVNAHVHLELSWMVDDPPPAGDFLDWVKGFVQRRDAEDEDTARRAAEQAVARVVERGTVAVADVFNRPWMPSLLGRSPLWGVAFYELFGFLPGRAEATLREAVERLDGLEHDLSVAEGRLVLALSPHAAHTTCPGLLKALAGCAAASKEPLSIHAAESAMEVAFLNEGAEDYRAFLAERNAWDDQWSAPGQSPVEYLDRHHVLGPNTLAVHCVHLTHHDIQRLQSRGVTVVTCPRSNASLGVGKAPVKELLREGIPVALGTDSLASAPDLDPFAEMVALLDHHPGLAPAAALRMATLNGARALGLADQLGSIETGKRAELIVVPLDHEGGDAWQTMLAVPERVWRLHDAPFEEPSG